MKSFLKFLVFVLFLALGISLLYVWQSKGPGTGLGQAKVEKFTPAEGPKIDLGSVDILQRLNEEYTRLFHAIVPPVVSIPTPKPLPTSPHPFDFFFCFPH